LYSEGDKQLKASGSMSLPGEGKNYMSMEIVSEKVAKPGQ